MKNNSSRKCGARRRGAAVEPASQQIAIGRDPDPAGLLKKRDIASLLKMNVRTVSRYMAIGLPHLKLNSHATRFVYADVLAWLKENFETEHAA
jgi:hypothetical protein